VLGAAQLILAHAISGRIGEGEWEGLEKGPQREEEVAGARRVLHKFWREARGVRLFEGQI